MGSSFCHTYVDHCMVDLFRFRGSSLAPQLRCQTCRASKPARRHGKPPSTTGSADGRTPTLREHPAPACSGVEQPQTAAHTTLRRQIPFEQGHGALSRPTRRSMPPACGHKIAGEGILRSIPGRRRCQFGGAAGLDDVRPRAGDGNTPDRTLPAPAYSPAQQRSSGIPHPPS